MIKLTKDLVFFDLETTGIDTKTDKIVEISLTKIKVNGIKEKLYFLINPEIDIPEEASNIHHITNESVKDSPKFGDVKDEIFGFIKGCDLGGYNSNRFDVPILINEFSRVDINISTEDISLVDVFDLYKKLFSNSLSAVYKRLTGKDLEGAHGASVDINATISIFNILCECLDGELDAKGLDLFTQGDKKLRFDLDGKMYINKDDGLVYWNFGAHINKLVTSTPDYISWVLRSDFAVETKSRLRELIKN